MIEVTLDPSKTDIHKIHEAIAKSGHDTEMHSASDAAYEKLPECCKYERMGTQSASCCSGSNECGDEQSAQSSGGHQH